MPGPEPAAPATVPWHRLNPAALLTSFTTETLDPGTAPVTHIFTLTVTDNQGSDAATDTVTFTVNAPGFTALVAVAGTGGTVSHGQMVPLVGTGSTVSDSNRTITYAWARTGGTGDSSVAPLAPAALLTSFTAETLTRTASVTHIFTLTVTDNQGSDRDRHGDIHGYRAGVHGSCCACGR